MYTKENKWKSGRVPISVVMISLNEGHNIKEVCENLSDWAQEVILIDSYSKDDTIDIALNYGIKVIQKKFEGFGSQWNFALNEAPINCPWVMKLDPDERLTDELKINIAKMISLSQCDALSIKRRLWFMGRPLPIYQKITRVWKKGVCRFSDVSVNEYPIIKGSVVLIDGELEHHDSPNLDHWIEKQNRYTTDEAIISYKKQPLADEKILFGTSLQRRMWLKNFFYKVPLRYFILFLYHFVFQKAYRAGRVGYIWAKFRVDVMRLVDYKSYEMKIKGGVSERIPYGPGKPDKRVKNFSE